MVSLVDSVKRFSNLLCSAALGVSPAIASALRSSLSVLSAASFASGQVRSGFGWIISEWIASR